MSELISFLRETFDFVKWENVSLPLGFISAWLLFELTERRRVRIGQRELRRALLAELENAEVLVCTFVCKYARFCKSEADIAAVAEELRWFYDVGRQRMQELSPDYSRSGVNGMVSLD
jgi:hypothetical protein